MIIVSQNKENIVNFDNIVHIDIDEDNCITAETDGDCVDLGQYKTKERAKEVLIDIIQFYANLKDYDELTHQLYGISKRNVFCMSQN